MANQLTTVPSAQLQAVAEDVTWGCDVTALLTGAQTVTAPSATLVDTITGATVALVDPAAAAGNVISQRVRSGVLVAGETYRLSFKFTPSGTTNVLVSALGLLCPF